MKAWITEYWGLLVIMGVISVVVILALELQHHMDDKKTINNTSESCAKPPKFVQAAAAGARPHLYIIGLDENGRAWGKKSRGCWRKQ